MMPSPKMFNRWATLYRVSRTEAPSEGEWTEVLEPIYERIPCNVQAITVNRMIVSGMQTYPFSHNIYFPWYLAKERGGAIILEEDIVIGVDINNTGREDLFDVVTAIERQSDPGRFMKIAVRIREVEAYV